VARTGAQTPPKRAAELIILIARETNRWATVRRPDPPLAEGPAGRDLSRRTGIIGASRPADPCQRALAFLNLKIHPVDISLSVPTRRVGKRRAGTCCQRFCGATLTAPQSHCLTADQVICGCVLPRRPGNRKIWNVKPKLRVVLVNTIVDNRPKFISLLRASPKLRMLAEEGHSKAQGNGYEKVRSMPSNAGIGCPLPQYMEWRLVGSCSVLFGSLQSYL
jgi:hypothetical protein